VIERHDAARVVVTIGGITVVVGSFAPWVASGAVDRSSYDLLDLRERLGFADDGPFAAAVRWWPIVPLLVAVALVAVWWSWVRTGALVGSVAGAFAASVAGGVVTAPDSDLVTVLGGAMVTLVGALVLVAGSVATWLTARRPGRRADQPAGLG
jgi:hypothetical protein